MFDFVSVTGNDWFCFCCLLGGCFVCVFRAGLCYLGVLGCVLDVLEFLLH